MLLIVSFGPASLIHRIQGSLPFCPPGITNTTPSQGCLCQLGPGRKGDAPSGWLLQPVSRDCQAGLPQHLSTPKPMPTVTNIWAVVSHFSGIRFELGSWSMF